MPYKNLQIINIGAYTYANLPSATTLNPGTEAYVTDVGGGTNFVTNGTRWKPKNNHAIIYNKGAIATMMNTEAVVGQYLMPVNLVQQYDILRLRITIGKSAGAETATTRVRVGTAGTIADTQITSSAMLTTTNVSYGWLADFRLETATTLQKLGSASTQFPYTSASTAAVPAAIAISSAASNALYFNVTNAQSSNAETFTLYAMTLELITS